MTAKGGARLTAYVTPRVARLLVAAAVLLACAAAVVSPATLASFGPEIAAHDDAQTVARVSGPTSDIAHYEQAGEEIAELRPIHPHYVQFWTLGQALVVAAVRRLTGDGWHPLKLSIATALAWVVALTLAALLLPPGGRYLLAVPGALLLLSFPDLRAWLFGAGSLLSDASAAAWLVAGCAVTLAALAAPRLRTFAAAGLLLGVAANFRYANLMVTRIVLAVMLALLLSLLWRRGHAWRGLGAAMLGRPLAAVDAPTRWLQQAWRGTLLLALVFYLSLVPWTAYKAVMHGTLKWYTASASLKYGRMWLPDDQQAVWAHGANAQCHADPALCREIGAGRHPPRAYFRLGVMTTLRHPFAVAAYKLRAFSWLWWGQSWDALAEDRGSLVEGIVLLLLGIAGVVAFGRYAATSRHPAALVAFVALAVFVLHNAALYTFVHFEWRYSAPLRVLCAVAPLLAGGFRARLERHLGPMLETSG